MVEESPFRTSQVEPEEAPTAESAEEECVAVSSISSVLIRAREEAAELLKRARAQDGDLNEATLASSAAVSFTKKRDMEGYNK